MPKSSRTRRTPSSLSASRVAVALSPTPRPGRSRSPPSAGGPGRGRCERGSRATDSARSRCATWRAERLTETSSGRWSGRRSCQLERLAAGRLLHPAADRLDQAAVLGDRDELAWVEQAALGVMPAHQRLDADDLAVAAGRPPAGSAAPARRGRARGAARARSRAGARARARISASKSSQRALPRSFARYIAASASRIRSSASIGSRPVGRATAMPMLAVTK